MTIAYGLTAGLGHCVLQGQGARLGPNRGAVFCILLMCLQIFTPRAHARARGYVIGRGVYYILYIIYILYICKDFFLSFKILTFRRPFQHRKASLRI